MSFVKCYNNPGNCTSPKGAWKPKTVFHLPACPVRAALKAPLYRTQPALSTEQILKKSKADLQPCPTG